MLAIDLVRQIKNKDWKDYKGYYSEEDYFARFLKRIDEIEVSKDRIYIREVIPEVSNASDIKKKLNMKVKEKGYWVYFYIGHDGEIIIINYKNKLEAETELKELTENDFVSDCYIINISKL